MGDPRVSPENEVIYFSDLILPRHQSQNGLAFAKATLFSGLYCILYEVPVHSRLHPQSFRGFPPWM